MILAVKNRIKILLEILVLEQTLFALPFAYIGLLLAGLHQQPAIIPSYRVWILVTLAMVGARTAGMSFNRIIDRKIDAENPRTKNRALAIGRVSPPIVWGLAFVSLLLLGLAAYLLNSLCFYLSPFAAFLLFTYSYCKRFTWFSHFVLGIVESFAPIGGWLAVTGELHVIPFLLGILIIFWMVGLDIIYACQDYEHDKKVGLYSIPSCFGLKKSLLFAKISHFISVLCIVAIGILLPMGVVYWVGVFTIVSLFIYEHSLVSPKDLSRVSVAFFKVNSWIAVLLSVFIGIEAFLMVR